MSRSLTEMMKDHEPWAREHFGNNNGLEYIGSMLGMAEEFGELCRVVLKRLQNIRKEVWSGEDEFGITPEEDALADILIYWLDYCHRAGITNPQAIVETVLYQRVLKRKYDKPRDYDVTKALAAAANVANMVARGDIIVDKPPAGLEGIAKVAEQTARETFHMGQRVDDCDQDV